MTVPKDSPAVQIARAQVKAWSNHDLAAARAAVAGNAALAVTTTQAEAPAVNTVVNTTGIDGYMAGHRKFVKGAPTGSPKGIGGLREERNPPLRFTVGAGYAAVKVPPAHTRPYPPLEEH